MPNGMVYGPHHSLKYGGEVAVYTVTSFTISKGSE